MARPNNAQNQPRRLLLVWLMSSPLPLQGPDRDHRLRTGRDPTKLRRECSVSSTLPSTRRSRGQDPGPEPAVRSDSVDRIRIMGVCFVVVGGLCAPGIAQKKAPGGTKVYILSGGQRQHHGYRDQAFYLAEALENTGRYEVTLGEDAAILETPAIRKYDLI